MTVQGTYFSTLSNGKNEFLMIRYAVHLRMNQDGSDIDSISDSGPKWCFPIFEPGNGLYLTSHEDDPIYHGWREIQAWIELSDGRKFSDYDPSYVDSDEAKYS